MSPAAVACKPLLGFTTRCVSVENVLDELCLAEDVRLSIAGMPDSELVLQSRIGVADRSIGTEDIAEAQVAYPMCAVPLHQVKMVRPELATAEELAARQTAVPTIHVAQRFKHDNVSRRVGARCVPRPNVKNWLGGKARDSRAADVFQSKVRQSGRRHCIADSFGLPYEQRRPTIVVRNDSYRLGFKTERLRHRMAQRSP